MGVMRDIGKALYSFWSQFGVPAYAEGRVPTKVSRNGQNELVDPPYITYDVKYGELFATIELVAMNWHTVRNGVDTTEERDALMELIAEAIPVQGALIDLDNGGFLALHRGPEFQTAYNVPEEPNVIGGRTSYTVTYYTL